MSRHIFFPELKSIHLDNYTLYPNGLDYSYDFVNGINLILGGNGMGKTTFVNIIKFGLIGLYRKQNDYTRTYREKAIVKRLLHSPEFFSARMDDSVKKDGEAMVTLEYILHGKNCRVQRSLEDGRLLSVVVDGMSLPGNITPEAKYEKLPEFEKSDYLLHSYEDMILEYSNLSFDDMIFFVNEILFFGEDHKTVLWNEGSDGRYDVQNELFNKYFNEPALDMERQTKIRESKYYDSLARHKSEDMRVIHNLMQKFNDKGDRSVSESVEIGTELVDLEEQLEKIKMSLTEIHSRRESVQRCISQIEGEINADSIRAAEYDKERNAVEKAMNSKLWEKLHPQYDVFIKNMQMNRICPMCNQPAEGFIVALENDPTHCFFCGNEIHLSQDDELSERYKVISRRYRELYQGILNKQKKVKVLQEEMGRHDTEYKKMDLSRRIVMQNIREL